jgi:hypothetical protein
VKLFCKVIASLWKLTFIVKRLQIVIDDESLSPTLLLFHPVSLVCDKWIRMCGCGFDNKALLSLIELRSWVRVSTRPLLFDDSMVGLG